MDRKPTVNEAAMTLPNNTKRRAIVDTHRHPIGRKLAAKMAERGFYDPKREFPQTNAQDLIGYREFYDLEYAMPKSREEGVTLSQQWRRGGMACAGPT
jgi:hypothetical protein